MFYSPSKHSSRYKGRSRHFSGLQGAHKECGSPLTAPLAKDTSFHREELVLTGIGRAELPAEHTAIGVSAELPGCAACLQSMLTPALIYSIISWCKREMSPQKAKLKAWSLQGVHGEQDCLICRAVTLLPLLAAVPARC